MYQRPQFFIGDLVRRRSLLTHEKTDYGVVVEINPDKILCLWNDGKEVLMRPIQIYLIARGQNGEKS